MIGSNAERKRCRSEQTADYDGGQRAPHLGTRAVRYRYRDEAPVFDRLRESVAGFGETFAQLFIHLGKQLLAVAYPLLPARLEEEVHILCVFNSAKLSETATTALETMIPFETSSGMRLAR